MRARQPGRDRSTNPLHLYVEGIGNSALHSARIRHLISRSAAPFFSGTERTRLRVRERARGTERECTFSMQSKVTCACAPPAKERLSRLSVHLPRQRGHRTPSHRPNEENQRRVRGHPTVGGKRRHRYRALSPSLLSLSRPRSVATSPPFPLLFRLLPRYERREIASPIRKNRLCRQRGAVAQVKSGRLQLMLAADV